ncbi:MULTISPECIES: hypothetical protein [unclassified Psychrobacter]|uniref:hypothetical protein n=1 Tax=unclassified Psychrobacter TaxID=196806 RepID=UPI0018F7C863|nr:MULTISPECIES: hypothetical protein [unclassified Psychrobacter]
MLTITSLAIALLTLAALTPLAVSGMSASKLIKNSIAAPVLPITHFPNTLSKDCNDGAVKLYDECAAQVTILKDALCTARAENKKVLIVYGGE